MTRAVLPSILLIAFASSAAADGLLFVPTWPKQVQVIDEAKEQVVDRIELSTGPSHGLKLSEDRKTIYVSTVDHNGIEVIDVPGRKVTNAFVLDEGNKRVRTSGFAPDPEGKLLYTLIRVAEKKIDRFEISPLRFAVIDLAQKKIVRTADFPKEEDQGNIYGRAGNIRISPDGKYLYLFRHNVLIFDTADFKLIDKIELAKPEIPGMMNIGLSQELDSIQEPGQLVSLFNSSDPAVRRQIFGIAHFDLTRRTFEFAPIGPATTGLMGLHVTPDHKTGYTVATSGGGGNKRSEFWVFDLATNRLARRQEFDGRSRFNFAISSTGKNLYIYGAGYQVEIYDAASLQLRKTIDVNADITAGMIVLPGR